MLLLVVLILVEVAEGVERIVNLAAVLVREGLQHSLLAPFLHSYTRLTSWFVNRLAMKATYD